MASALLFCSFTPSIHFHGIVLTSFLAVFCVRSQEHPLAVNHSAPMGRECFRMVSSLWFQSLSRVKLFGDPMDCVEPPTPQAPLSMGFSGQEYWSGLPCAPPPGNLPDSGVEHGSPVLQADSLPSEPPGKLTPGPIHPKHAQKTGHRPSLTFS